MLNLVAHLLHMPEHILPAVKHTLAFLRIQVKDKVSGVVGVAFLISATKVTQKRSEWDEIHHRNIRTESQLPQNQSPLHSSLHLLHQMLYIIL